MGSSYEAFCVVCGNKFGREHQRNIEQKRFECDMCGNVYDLNLGDGNKLGKNPSEINIVIGSLTNPAFRRNFNDEDEEIIYHCHHCGNLLTTPLGNNTLYQCANKKCDREYEITFV